MHEHGARDVAVGARGVESPFRRFDVPVGELVPDEAARGLRVLVQAKSCIPLLGQPEMLVSRRHWTECRIAFGDCAVEPGEDPLVGPCQLGRVDVADAMYPFVADGAEDETPDVPEFRREVASCRERLL